MDELYDNLPPLAALGRTARIELCYGAERIQLLCFAAAIRTVEWKDTLEMVTWLHCVAALGESPKKSGPGVTMTLLVPVRNIVDCRPGPKPRGRYKHPKSDVAIFPPELAALDAPLPLEKLQAVLSSLQRPARKVKPEQSHGSHV